MKRNIKKVVFIVSILTLFLIIAISACFYYQNQKSKHMYRAALIADYILQQKHDPCKGQGSNGCSLLMQRVSMKNLKKEFTCKLRENEDIFSKEKKKDPFNLVYNCEKRQMMISYVEKSDKHPEPYYHISYGRDTWVGRSFSFGTGPIKNVGAIDIIQQEKLTKLMEQYPQLFKNVNFENSQEVVYTLITIPGLSGTKWEGKISSTKESIKNKYGKYKKPYTVEIF